jgi:hypothetical protein
MFGKLKNKWKVSGLQVVLILCTFAIGGTLCGWVGRKLMFLTPFDRTMPLYWVLYLLLITILWPISVMIVSLPLGQYVFFRGYLSRMWSRIRGRRKSSS